MNGGSVIPANDKALPHPNLPPEDLQFLARHRDVWVHVEYHDLERQRRIIEGWRQLLALRDGTTKCPATGRACKGRGYGRHGLHVECVELNYT